MKNKKVLRFRFLNWLYAKLRDYFWEPCKLCGKKFGGHEFKKSAYSYLPIKGSFKGLSSIICPECEYIRKNNLTLEDLKKERKETWADLKTFDEYLELYILWAYVKNKDFKELSKEPGVIAEKIRKE